MFRSEVNVLLWGSCEETKVLRAYRDSGGLPLDLGLAGLVRDHFLDDVSS